MKTILNVKTNKALQWFALSFAIITCSSTYSQVIINEYSCSNMGHYMDNYVEYEDWVELHNMGASAVDLTGYYFSDKASNLTKWQIPSGSIPANGYKMIIGSKRGTVNGNEIHVSFNWKQVQGEWIILSNTLGNVVDSIKIIHRTQTDHSVGRSTNGAPDWKLFTNPTPNASNTGAQDFYEPTPVMDLAPGFYTGSQTVTITCSDPAATIHYTTDGTNPNAGSPVYSAPLTINSTTVVRARAYGANEPSFRATNTYFIDVNHSVPVVSVCSWDVYDLIANGNQSWVNDVGSLELFEQDGTFIDEGEGDFNKHGNDSWAYPQRGFDFIMRDQFGYNDDLDHLIFPNDKDRQDFQRIILKPGASDNYPFEDGAHIRDAFIHTLSIRSDLLLDERTWRPCVVYLNGQYWGVYEIREKADDHDFTDYYWDQDKFDLYYLKTWGGTWEEYSPTPGEAQQDWDDLRNFIMANNMAPGPDWDYAKSKLKWASLADYFMVNSWAVNQDWLNWNTAWWRGINPLGSKKKWRYALWDMDATFGHYINYTGIPDPTANADPCNAENLPNPGGQGHTDILEKLINENPIVEQYYITRYADLLNTTFSCTYSIALLDSMINEITPEMTAHCAKWGGSVAQWQSNVQDMRDFINARCTALEQGLIDCYTLNGPHDVTFDVEPVNSGVIKVNSIYPPNYPWTTQYYGGIQTITIAQPEVGYTFDHWEYSVGPMINPITVDTNGVDFTAQDSIVAVFIATNPDIDGDGIPNVDETGCLDPTNPDTDGDGINDGDEVNAGTDPCDGCDPDTNSPVCDSDGDGILNVDENAGCTDPFNADTDSDGINDLDEITAGSDPCNPCDPDPNSTACVDTDGDGVPDVIETSNGTDPNDHCSYMVSSIVLEVTSGADCDGDGILDVDEIANGSNPFDACDPNAVGLDCVTGVHIPTGFSPNGDGTHETYSIIVGIDVVDIKFSIYDRWGNRMFFTDAKDFEWDGMYNGEMCNAGVYAYIAEVIYANGSAELISGNITLVR